MVQVGFSSVEDKFLQVTFIDALETALWILFDTLKLVARSLRWLWKVLPVLLCAVMVAKSDLPLNAIFGFSE